MKKLLSLLGVVALLTASVNVVNAQLLISELFSGKEALNPGSYAKLLNEYDNNRGYTSSYDVIETVMTGDVVSIISPIVADESLDVVPEYRLIVSPYRISALKSLDSNVDFSNVIMKSSKLEGDSNTISFELSEEVDKIDPEVGYYGVIVPLDMYDVVGTPSEEFCFQKSSKLHERDDGCNSFELVVSPAAANNASENAIDTTENDNNGDNNSTTENNANIENNANTESNTNIEGNTNAEGNFTSENNINSENVNAGEHGAANNCAGMDLANVSHTVNGNQITLTWTAVDGDSVQIAIFDPEEEVYRSLGTAKMSDEKFTYTMKWNGEQNVMLTNGCKEVYYKADASIKKAEPTIVPTRVGPAENILYVAIAAIILYGVYVLFFRKADNK